MQGDQRGKPGEYPVDFTIRELPNRDFEVIPTYRKQMHAEFHRRLAEQQGGSENPLRS